MSQIFEYIRKQFRDFCYSDVTREDGTKDWEFVVNEDIFSVLLILLLLTSGYNIGFTLAELLPKPPRAYDPRQPHN